VAFFVSVCSSANALPMKIEPTPSVMYFCVFQDLRTKNWKLIEEIQLAPTRNATNNKLSSDPNSLLMNNEKVVSFPYLNVH
jgi:hypothetical protein